MTVKHLTQQIAEAVVTRLTGLTATQDNVFDGEPRALLQALPALVLKEGAEHAAIATCAIPRRSERTYLLDIEIKVKDGTPMSELRDIRRQVETAMASDRTFGGLVKDSYLTGKDDPHISYDLEKPVGVMPLHYEIKYACPENQPTTPA
ncbi:MAG: hypothetical protein WC100_00905 [Sterolibacterium sp.]